jgi:hypothetical protein
LKNKYTLLIDESGDQGLDKVMTRESSFGASSYLTIGAVLIPTKFDGLMRSFEEKLRSKLGVSRLHCADLNHPQVAYFAQQLALQRILMFGVISKKSTLGSYQESIEGTHKAQDYYNKCCQYLFELVGSFAGENKLSSDDIKVVFEEKRGHDYRRMERYLRTISDKPIDSRAAKLAHLRPFIINSASKSDEPLLAFADLVAYSLHKSFSSENNKLRITEQRYLREIKHKFYKHPKTKQIANNGIKFIKGPMSMGLGSSDFQFAMKFYSKVEPEA